MSAIAFFTRALVFCQAWLPSLFSTGAGPVSVERYFWIRSSRVSGTYSLASSANSRIIISSG